MRIGKIIAFGKISVDEKWYSGDALYKTNRIYVAHSGSALCNDGGKTVIAGGRIYFVPETIRFAPSVMGAEPFLHSYADFSLISPTKCDRIISLEADGSEEMRLAMRTFLLGCERKSCLEAGSSEAKDGFFGMFNAAIAYLVARIADANGADFISDRVVTRAISMMNERMNEKLTVTDLASYVYMCEDGFIRRFSRVMGMTPYAYLRRLRLSTAEGLMNDGKPVADAAERVGYSDASALMHALKKKNYEIAFK